MIKTKVTFWRADFYPASESNLKSFQKALIGWKKAGPPKKNLCFYHVNRLYMSIEIVNQTILSALSYS